MFNALMDKNYWSVATADHKKYKLVKDLTDPNNAGLKSVFTGSRLESEAFLKAIKASKPYNEKDISFRVVHSKKSLIFTSSLVSEPNVGDISDDSIIALGSKTFCENFIKFYELINKEACESTFGLYWCHFSDYSQGTCIRNVLSPLTSEFLIMGNLSKKEALALEIKYNKGTWFVVKGDDDKHPYKIVDVLKKGDEYFFTANYIDCARWIQLIENASGNPEPMILKDTPPRWFVWKTNESDNWSYSYGESTTNVPSKYQPIAEFDSPVPALNLSTDLINEAGDINDNEEEEVESTDLTDIRKCNPILEGLTDKQLKDIVQMTQSFNFSNKNPLLNAAKEFSNEKSDQEAFRSGARWLASEVMNITSDSPSAMNPKEGKCINLAFSELHKRFQDLGVYEEF